jgi:hypothetical protein
MGKFRDMCVNIWWQLLPRVAAMFAAAGSVDDEAYDEVTLSQCA